MISFAFHFPSVIHSLQEPRGEQIVAVAVVAVAVVVVVVVVALVLLANYMPYPKDRVHSEKEEQKHFRLAKIASKSSLEN